MLGLEFSCIRERDNSSDLYAVAIKKAHAKGHMQFKVSMCNLFYQGENSIFAKNAIKVPKYLKFKLSAIQYT